MLAQPMATIFISNSDNYCGGRFNEISGSSINGLVNCNNVLLSMSEMSNCKMSKFKL
jgi:hypothetical protein